MAQNAETHNVVSYHTGIGAVNFPLVYSDTTSQRRVQFEGSNVHALSFDYLIGNRFSLGAKMSFQARQVNVYDSITESILESGKVNQFYIGLRGLWHFGKSTKFDFYSGFKLGMRFLGSTNVQTAAGYPEKLKEDFSGSLPSFGFIPIGIRYFFKIPLGIHFETSLGAPSFLTIGANYRF